MRKGFNYGCLPVLLFWTTFGTSGGDGLGAIGDTGEDLRCGIGGNENLCVLGGRFQFYHTAMEARGAGDVDGHPMIQVTEGLGVGKLVVQADDLLTNEHVFLKCRPGEGAKGKVEGVGTWRGEEAEKSVANNSFVMTAQKSFHTDRGATACFVYPLAKTSLSETLQSGKLQPMEGIIAVFHVAQAVTALHQAGFVHRDIKHRNVLLRGGESEGDGQRWQLADLDAAGKLGEEVWEFMGFPWSVWVPNVQIGAWPNAVPSPEQARKVKAHWSGGKDVEPLFVDPQHDAFQLGVLVYEVTCRTSLLTGRPGRQVLESLADPEPINLEYCPAMAHIPGGPELLELAKQLVRKDPKHRATVETAVTKLRRLLLARGVPGSTKQEQAHSSVRCDEVDYCYNIKVQN